MSKLEALVGEFRNSVRNLADVLRQKKTDYIRDSAIKRFELAFDLSWKAIKALLELWGVRCASPLACFKEAFRNGLIDYDEIWIEMVKTRNYTVHTYKEELAEQVYTQLPEALAAFEKLVAILEKDKPFERREHGT